MILVEPGIQKETPKASMNSEVDAAKKMFGAYHDSPRLQNIWESMDVVGFHSY